MSFSGSPKEIFILNIGCVIYNKDIQNGSLSADWCFENGKKIKGTGIATGRPGADYAGEYEIVYTDGNGNKSAKYNLQIVNDNGFYSLRWYLNRELKYVGTGILHGKLLIGGWKEI